MAHTKQRMAREIKRAGQIERVGLVEVVSDDEPANEAWSEEDWLAADLARNVNKGQVLAARNDRVAFSIQLNGSGRRPW